MCAAEPVSSRTPPRNPVGSTSLLETSSAAVGASALRKASVRLIPLIAIAYGVAYTDRVNISFAALQMNRDLHFSASAYGFGAGLFFISYAACEIPSNLLLVRFGARRWIARIMLTWGILAAGMLLVRTPAEFYAARFLLGMAEAGFFPGVVYYLSQWFPANMRARTVSQFYMALPLSSVVMGSVAGALLGLQGKLGLAGWQWLFLAEGLPAVLLSFAFFFFLPDTPADAKWLSAVERDWLIEQLRADNSAVGTAASSAPPAVPENGHAAGVFHAILDPRVLQLGLLLFCIYIVDYAVKFTAPLIIRQITGFSDTKVGFTIAILGLLAAVSIVLNGMHSDRTNERYLHIAVPVLLMTAACVVSGLSVAPIAVLPAFAVLFMGFTATAAPVWAIPSSFLTGKSAAAGIAAVNTIAILGGFVGPYWMGLAKDWTGNYQNGLLTMAAPELIGAAIVLRMWNQVRKKPTVPPVQ
jgi:ACS family tartrate transporter-like MFS transporter